MWSRRPGTVSTWKHPALNPWSVSLAGLAVVLLALGWLQYHWIDEVSQAQETRTKSRFEQELRAISDALDTEITRAALFFSLPPDSIGYAALEERWDSWNREARWPRIASGVALIESAGGGWRTRWLGDSGTFDPSWIPASEAYREPLPPAAPGPGAGHFEVHAASRFVAGQPYWLQPVPAVSESSWPPRITWLAIHYNLPYVAAVVFPRLMERYANAEDRLEYRFEISPNAQAVPGVIASAELFHFRPDCLMANGPGGPSLTMGGFSVSVAASPHGARGISRQFAVARGVPSGALLHQAGQCQIPSLPSGGGLLQISVRVRASRGTLRDAYSGFRRRNEILGGAVLLALLAALAALVVTAVRARRLARLQTAIAAGISHELRTPLASLSLAADDLKNGHVDSAGQVRRYGEIVDSQARRLRHIVDQALSLTRLTQSNAAACLRTVSVSAILDAVVEAMHPVLAGAGMEVQESIAPDLPCVLADPDLVQRSLSNLIENAIKYAGPDRTILISMRPARHGRKPVVEVTIEDRGPGIGEEEMAAVFEPFYRGESARRSRQPGSGLGLAIVKSAMEANGGWVKLERSVPQGCKFRLFFPSIEATS